MVLMALMMVLSAAPKVSGDASVSMKIDGKQEYAAGVHAIVPIPSEQFAVSVDVTSKTIANAPTAAGGITLLSKEWAFSIAMRAQADGTVQPCVNARATVMRGAASLTAAVNVAPNDSTEKVTASLMWASQVSPVAVKLSASTAGSVTVGMSVTSM